MKYGGVSTLTDPFSFDLEVNRVMENFRSTSTRSHQVWNIPFSDVNMGLIMTTIGRIIRVLAYLLYCVLILIVAGILSFLHITPLPTIHVNTFIDGFHLGSFKMNNANGEILVIPKVSHHTNSEHRSHRSFISLCIEHIRTILVLECITTLRFNLQWVSPFAEISVETITVKESVSFSRLIKLVAIAVLNAAFAILASGISKEIRLEDVAMFADIASCLLHDAMGLLLHDEHDRCTISYRSIDSILIKNVSVGHVSSAFYVFALDGSDLLRALSCCSGQSLTQKALSRWKFKHVLYASPEFEAILSNFNCTIEDDSASRNLQFDWDRLEIVRVDNYHAPSSTLLSIDTFEDDRIRTISEWDDAPDEVVNRVLRPILGLRNVHGSTLCHSKPSREPYSAYQLAINSLHLRSTSEVTLHSPSVYRIIPHPIFVHTTFYLLTRFC